MGPELLAVSRRVAVRVQGPTKPLAGAHRATMFDPLSESATPFAIETPSWQHTDIPDASSTMANYAPESPLPPTPQKAPSDNLYGKEPQIYGAPEAGLISPRETVGSNGTKFEKSEPYLRVRITGLDRNRRDILIRLDAQVNAYTTYP